MSSSYNTSCSKHKLVVSIYSNTETSLAMSTLAIWCCVVRSRDVRSRDFSETPAQCRRRTKINWTKTAHRIREHISTMPTHIRTVVWLYGWDEATQHSVLAVLGNSFLMTELFASYLTHWRCLYISMLCTMNPLLTLTVSSGPILKAWACGGRAQWLVTAP